MKINETHLGDYRPQAMIRVTGEDAFSFLQGQFSNELRHPVGSATYGLWLNQKGKVVADSHVLRLGENEFLIASVNSPAATIQQRLEDYIVADDVSLTDETATVGGLLVGGAASGERISAVMGTVPSAGRLAIAGAVLVFQGRRLPGQSFEIIAPGESLGELRQRFVGNGAVEAAPHELEFARIAAGIAAIPQDVGPGDLPNEGGLAESAVCYSKGCFLGQEVMARLKNLGQVRRRLLVLRGPGLAPPREAPVFQGEKKVGEIRSAAGSGREFVALGMFSLVNLDPAGRLSLTPMGPPDLRLSTDE